MRILFLSFFFQPDLSAGSFRNTALAKALKDKLGVNDRIEVITTLPNRYHSYKTLTTNEERDGNIFIKRINLTKHKNGFLDQVLSFEGYFRKVLKLVRKEKYDLVYASSSKLFTAFLGALIARTKKIPLYLDFRDIFVDTINDVIRNKALKLIMLPLMKRAELFTCRSASHINLVSEGFRDYFKRIYNGPITYYSNGIDAEFILPPSTSVKKYKDRIIITYAGNIGEGQGLEKIIPYAAAKLGSGYLFRIIGDGGTRQKLLEKIKETGAENIEIIPPVNRRALIKYYEQSDFLFLHLNNYKAFEKVLPSKIFEYGALRKRIIAGVAGFSKSFIENNLPDSIIFNPGNADDFISKIIDAKDQVIDRELFISKYSRGIIIEKLADSILSTAGNLKSEDDFYLVPETKHADF